MVKRILFLLPLIFFFGILFSFKSLAFDKEEFSQDTLVIRFEEGVTDGEKEEILSTIEGKKERKLEKIGAERIKVKKYRVRESANKLKRNRKVKYVEPDFIATKAFVPNDTFYSLQWGLPKVRAEGAWDKNIGSNSFPVAVVDTGIDESHPDLNGKVVKRVNFTTDPDVDGDGHGTHVAGIVAATTNNSAGVASLGFDTKLISVKSLDNNGSGYYSWIANGIIWATDHGARVINLSLGGSSDSQLLRDAVNYAWERGVVVVAAAGNSNRTTASYPAYYTNSIAVAATDSSDAKASFSNYGSWVDLAAPGVSIYSTYKGGYAYLSGTSMATPFVSALSSLVFSNNPTFSNQQVRNKVESSAERIFGTGSYWTHGRIDACAALDCSSGGLEPTPTPTPSPTLTPTPSPTPIPCLAPTIISNSDTNPTRGGTISISWNGINGASTYRVQRQNNNGSWSTRTTTSATSFTGSDSYSDPNWRIFIYSGSCRPLPGPSTVLDP